MSNFVGAYLAVMVAIFVLCSVMLDGSTRNETERKAIGWFGLAAPVWPLAALVGLVVIIYLSARRMYEAARGDG